MGEARRDGPRPEGLLVVPRPEKVRQYTPLWFWPRLRTPHHALHWHHEHPGRDSVPKVPRPCGLLTAAKYEHVCRFCSSVFRMWAGTLALYKLRESHRIFLCVFYRIILRLVVCK